MNVKERLKAYVIIRGKSLAAEPPRLLIIPLSFLYCSD